MELEEAKNNLNKLVELRKNKCGEIKFDTCICGTKDLEIVLQALEDIQKNYELAIKQNITYKQNIYDLKHNVIPKKKIEYKIKEYEELVEDFEKTDNSGRFKRTNSIDYYKLEVLKELLEEK